MRCFLWEVLLTTIYGLQRVIRYNQKLMPYYKGLIEKRNLPKDSPFIFLVISTIAAIVSNIIEGGTFPNTAYMLAIPSISHSITFSIIWHIEFPPQRTSLFGLGPTEDDTPESKHLELYIKMEELLREEQVYKDPQLRVNDLAQALGTNRTYISEVIKENRQTNFSDYINSYRIEHAKELLHTDNNGQQTLDQIAFESGFTSQSTFYRVFAKFESTTPAKYRDSIRR